MGFIRLFLALSVVAGHCGNILGTTGVGGQMAVQLFFIISGFYMTLILNEKYIGKNGSYGLFISNRFLRIYVLYWIVLIASMLVYVAFAAISGDIPNKFMPLYSIPANIFTWIYLFFSSITLIGHDAVLFLSINVNTGGLFFTSNFWDAKINFSSLYLVPQAWSLSIELMFYLVAPFILRLKWFWVMLIAVLSMALRVYLFDVLYLKNDPWTYRFFPTELFFFLLGYFSYLIYKRVKLPKLGFNGNFLLLISLLSAIIFYPFLSKEHLYYLPFRYKDMAYFVAFTLAIPIVFSFSKDSKRDTFIGELSYPIYIVHVLVQTLLGTFQNYSGFETNFGGEIVAAISIGFSLILLVVFVPRIEKFRQSRLLSN